MTSTRVKPEAFRQASSNPDVDEMQDGDQPSSSDEHESKKDDGAAQKGRGYDKLQEHSIVDAMYEAINAPLHDSEDEVLVI